MKTIDPEDYAAVKGLSVEDLCRIWSTLNHWEWPDDIPNPEPRPSTDDMKTFREKVMDSRRTGITQWIKGRVGEYTLLRYSNVTRDGRMTEDEFEDWWHGNFEDDDQAYMRDKERQLTFLAPLSGISVDEAREQLKQSGSYYRRSTEHAA